MPRSHEDNMNRDRHEHYVERLRHLLTRTFEEVDADLIEDVDTFAEVDEITGELKKKVRTLDDFKDVVEESEFLRGHGAAVDALFRHTDIKADEGRSVEDWFFDLNENAEKELEGKSEKGKREFEEAFPISKEEPFKTRRGERRTRWVARIQKGRLGAGRFAAAVV